MPTTRTIAFLSGALVLYLFANQTQVGWLYVMAALMGGTVLAAGLLSRLSLRGIRVVRHIGGGPVDLHEGETTTVKLHIHKAGAGTSHLRVLESCPLAAPDTRERALKLFIPSLPGGAGAELEYEVLLDRRGLHEFPPLALNSRSPFGFFKHSRSLSLPTRVLVYPEVRPLQRLDLLDRRAAPQITRQVAGGGYEVMGVRPFRPGDPARHIHWRSVARTGELISKEFADESQPGLSLLVDTFRHSYPDTSSKHVPFEWLVKAAASIGDYARRKGYPLHLMADPDLLAYPSGAVSWDGLLQYLARVQPNGKRRATEIINPALTQAFVAAFLPWPDETIVKTLTELHRQRIEVLVVVIDPASFPAGGPSGVSLADSLSAAGIKVRLLRYGHDWAGQLSDTTERVSVG